MNEKEFSKQYWINQAFKEISNYKEVSEKEWDKILDQEFYLSAFHHSDDLKDPLLQHWKSFQPSYCLPENLLWVNDLEIEMESVVIPMFEEYTAIEGVFSNQPSYQPSSLLGKEYESYEGIYCHWKLNKPSVFYSQPQADHFLRLSALLLAISKGFDEHRDVLCVYQLSQHFLLDILSITTIQRLFEAMKVASGEAYQSCSLKIIGETVLTPVQTKERSIDNMVRNTIQVMTAFFTGLDAITVKPHDFQFNETDLWARRMGFFIPILLKEEAIWPKNLIRSAFTGSVFLENASFKLGEKLWKNFIIQ